MDVFLVLPVFVAVRNTLKAFKLDNEYVSVFVSSVVVYEAFKHRKRVNDLPNRFRNRPRPFNNMCPLALELAEYH
jgi:hypothetical protein